MSVINAIQTTLRNLSLHTTDNITHDKQREIITRLKFIGTIKVGQKIDINNLRIETNSIITPLKRLIFGEGREKTYNFVSVTIERSFEIIKSYIHSDRISEQIFCQNIVFDLIGSIVGLKNIQQTYKDDILLFEEYEIKIINLREEQSLAEAEAVGASEQTLQNINGVMHYILKIVMILILTYLNIHTAKYGEWGVRPIR